MKKKTKKKTPPYVLFLAAFAAIMGVVVVNNLRPQEAVLLPVTDNAGTAVLATAGDALVAVFQDGQTAAWTWSATPARRAAFSAGTDRVCLLDGRRLAAVSKTGARVLSILDLASGKTLTTIPVGTADQDVRPYLSFDQSVLAVIRRHPADAAGVVTYECLTVDPDSELAGLPTRMTVVDGRESWVDFAVGSNRIVYAAGSRGETGRIAAVDLGRGTVLWDRTYAETKEFCSVRVSPDGQSILAGNRNGVLYRLDAAAGGLLKPIQLLKDGETRPITNDYSVLNLAFSPDGKYYAATINPPVYVLDAATDTVIHVFSPANKLVSKVAFSPDNQFIATSDVRAGYPIKIWKFPEENKD